jgi:hypothetical protein
LILKEKICNDGTFEFDFFADGVGIVGALLRWRDIDNHYSVEFSTKWIRFRKVVNGVDTIMFKSEKKMYAKNTWYRVRID